MQLDKNRIRCVHQQPRPDFRLRIDNHSGQQGEDALINACDQLQPLSQHRDSKTAQPVQYTISHHDLCGEAQERTEFDAKRQIFRFHFLVAVERRPRNVRADILKKTQPLSLEGRNSGLANCIHVRLFQNSCDGEKGGNR